MAMHQHPKSGEITIHVSFFPTLQPREVPQVCKDDCFCLCEKINSHAGVGPQ